MIFTLSLKLTVILVLALAGQMVVPRHLPQVKHLICTLTIAVSLLLPLLSRSPALAGPYTFAVSTGSLSSPTGFISIPFTWLWICGAMILLLRFLIGAVYLSWKTGRAAGDGRLRFGRVDSPVVWGWFKPVILMPPCAAKWNRERWSLAVAHERAHIDRGDMWTSALAAIAEAVYWFHPLIWCVTRLMRHEQELACDELVLEEGHDRVAYAELLVAMAGMREPAPLGCRMNGGKMRDRLERILQWKRGAEWTSARRWTVAAACAACFLIGAVVAPAAAEKGPYKIGGDVTAPQPIEKHEPDYTEQAKNSKIQGTVLMSIVITDKGVPKDIRVLKSLDSGLDQKAVEAVSSWRFKPATRKGRPVSVAANVEVHFRLVDDQKQGR